MKSVSFQEAREKDYHLGWYLLGRTINLTVRGAWQIKATLAWLTVYALALQVSGWLFWLALVVSASLSYSHKTRPFAPIIGDGIRIKKAYDEKEILLLGNNFIRQIGLISAKDENVYRVGVFQGKNQVSLIIDEPIDGLSPQKILDVCREHKDRWNALRVVSEDLGNGRQRIIFQQSDPLAGARNVVVKQTPKPIIGRIDNGENAEIDLMGNASHIIMQGQTRSGKSVLTQAVLGQIVGLTSVEIWGIDPNRVLLEPVSKAQDESHFALGSNALKAYELLQKLVADMDKRLEMLSEKGVEKLTDFDSETPLKVIVLEEYAGLIRSLADYDAEQKPADRIGARAKTLVGRLLAESAKVGYRVILIIQRADASLVDGSTRGQFATRITMGVDNADAVRMLHPNVSAEVAERVGTFKNGRALIFQDRVEHELQADLLEYQDFRSICAGIAQKKNQED